MSELAKIRRSRGFSQRALARVADMSPSSIYEIEARRRKPNPSTLRKLAGVLGVEVIDLLEEEERPKGRSPFSAERALTLADSDSVRREAKAASVEELQQTALELARFTKPQTREDLARNKDNEEVHHKEAHRRVIAHERIAIINVELDRRGASSPVELVVRQFNDAMTPPEETAQQSHEEQEGQETA